MFECCSRGVTLSATGGGFWRMSLYSCFSATCFMPQQSRSPRIPRRLGAAQELGLSLSSSCSWLGTQSDGHLIEAASQQTGRATATLQFGPIRSQFLKPTRLLGSRARLGYGKSGTRFRPFTQHVACVDDMAVIRPAILIYCQFAGTVLSGRDPGFPAWDPGLFTDWALK
jgi:hypothetical protein